MTSGRWTCIVVTCPYEHWCAPLQKELDYLPTDLLLVVPDPSDGVATDKKGVGSGGATLNALLVAAEHLSARAGHTTIVSNVLQTAKILVVHIGPSLLPVPMGLLPLFQNGLRSNLDNVVHLASELQGPRTAGIFVAGTDIHLKELKDVSTSMKIPDKTDICVLTVPAPKDYATRHGVCFSDVNGTVENILYQPDINVLDNQRSGSDDVRILSGLVWLSPDVGECLVGLHCLSPLDACTYMGIDSGESTLQISFYYDILTSACKDVTQQDFIEGRCGKTLMRGRSVTPAMKKARKLVWLALNRFSIKEMILWNYKHFYLPICNTIAQSEFLSLFEDGRQNLKYDEKKLIDYNLKSSSLELYSTAPLSDQIAFAFGMERESKENKWSSQLLDYCKSHPVKIIYKCNDNQECTVVFSLSDPIFCHYSSPGVTWLGLPVAEALKSLELGTEDVWKNIPENQRSLFNAFIFKCGDNFTSLAELKNSCDLNHYLKYARTLKEQIFTSQLEVDGKFESNAKHSDVYKIAAREGWAHRLLDIWDDKALKCLEAPITSKTTGELAYMLAMTGEVLGAMAGGRGGLRSGPASNKDFAQALQFIEQDRFKEGLIELKNVRERWLDQPDRMVRAARHYEGAVQSLIRKTVMSAQNQVQIDLKNCTNLPIINQWVEVKCPARLDLSGGWTDTPPICYELGGKVLDVAIQLNGENPIGCKAKRVEELSITIILSDDYEEMIQIKDLQDMANFCNPNAKGALVKCCLIAAGLLDMKCYLTLTEQLKSRLGSGLWLNSWANLPQGSGLGTSSILASAIMAAVWRCMGASFNNSDIIHSVLVVEQLLTTGGGWQDQVGGINPGINLGTSPQNPVVSVEVEHVKTRPEFLSLLESRLFVLYTGKPRLAKNLLQNVIRNWYCKDAIITKAFKDNYLIAEKCKEAVINEDLAGIGNCLNEYFTIKKILAPGSEPELVRETFSALKDEILGGTLCGAGGGGFLVALLKENVDHFVIQQKIRSLPGGESVQFYSVQIDNEGLVVC